MALSVSVNGGDLIPAENVILYDEDTPIAGAMQHGNIVVYADSVRDRPDFISMLQTLGIRVQPARAANITIKGNMGTG